MAEPDIEMGTAKQEKEPLNATGDGEEVEEKQEDAAEESPKPKKKGVGFAEPEEDEGKKKGAIEYKVASDPEDPAAALRPKKANRTTTLAKMRKTLADGAKETADVISDASSFSLANSVEAIVWAIQESKEDDWQIPNNLTLSEAFMMFWRKSDGSIEGRTTSASLQALAYGAMLADLIHMDKISAQKMNKKVGFINYEKYVIHPTSDLEFDSFLEEPFLEIVDQHGNGKRKTIAKYVEDVATSYSEGSLMVEVILESLVERKIIKETSTTTFLGTTTKKYPLGENKAVFENLTKTLRGILMDDGVKHTPFTLFLLRFMRQGDKQFMVTNPFMNHLLKNKMERKKAKAKWGGSLQEFDKLPGEA